VVVALGRPGSMKFISDKYYERGRDKDKDPEFSPIGTYKGNKKNPAGIKSPHPMCTDVLAETYGIPVYQEQAMMIFQKISGSTLVDADLFRRAIGKKSGYLFERCRKMFMEGCSRNGLSEGQMNAIWKLFEDFQGYSFNKSHSVAYALLGFWNAWLREFFPSEWYAAVLSTELSNSKKDMLEEQKFGYLKQYVTKLEWYRSRCRTRTNQKVHVLDPDVNLSHHVDALIDEKGHIILPLCTVPTIGGNAESIFLNRHVDGKPIRNYENLDDLVDRGGTSPSVLRTLIEAGAMDSIAKGETVDDMLSKLDESVLKKQARKKHSAVLARKGTEVDALVIDDLFGDFKGSASIQMIAQVNKAREEREAKRKAEQEAAKPKKKTISWD